MTNIWIISDVVETAYELLAKARELIKTSKVTAFINGDQVLAQEAIEYGADVVKLLEIPKNTVWEGYITTLYQEVLDEKPQLILIGATRRGKDLAAQLAALLDCACITECRNLEFDGKKAILKRVIFGGLAEKTIECHDFPIIATVTRRTFSKWEKRDNTRQGDVSKLDVPSQSQVRVVERRSKPKETVDIKDCQIVVGVGRGFAKQNDLVIAEELAEKMNGVIACSRPIAEDLHWLPEDRYIGISGQVIKPNIYLAIGISGQVQHVYGIRDAKTIVSIDKNENAPIFSVSDYYIIGDLYEVLPALIQAMKGS